MIKVLVVNTVPTDRNGVTNVIFNYYRAIDKRVVIIDYVAINTPSEEYRQILVQSSSKLYLLKRSIRHIFTYIRALKKISRGYDIIHVHGNSATMVLEMYAAWRAGVSVRIAHSHNSNCKYRFLDKVCRIPFYLLCNNSFACSKKAGRWLFGNRKFIILNNGIDTNRFIFKQSSRDYIRKLLAWNDCKIIGHVGNFLEAKNHTFLIDIFYSLYQEDSSYRLLLIGEGGLEQQIRDKVSYLALCDKVCFVGAINNVYDYLSAMDVIVMPSLYEGLPLTLVEEQANGLDCIVADTISSEVDLTGLVHFKSLSEDKSFWVKSIQSIVLNSQQRLQESQQAIQSIRRKGYDIYEQSDKLLNYYRSSIE